MIFEALAMISWDDEHVWSDVKVVKQDGEELVYFLAWDGAKARMQDLKAAAARGKNLCVFDGADVVMLYNAAWVLEELVCEGFGI